MDADKLIPFCCVQELHGYSKEELKKKLGFNDNPSFLECVKKLKAYGILKSYKKNSDDLDLSDLTDDEETIEDDEAKDIKSYYAFKYVGIVTYGRRVINIFPKYLREIPAPDSKDYSEIKQMLRVIEKDSHNDPQNLKFIDVENEGKTFNYLALSLFMLEDYHEHGIYRKDYEVIEVNGEGEILWEKTINEGFALIQNNRPYYTEIYTRRSVNNSENFFRRLHECILTEISSGFEALRLNELFDITTVELSEITIDELEEKEYIKELILKELNVEFNTRKQMLLKAMYVYLDQNNKSMGDDSSVSLFGTNSFNMVWERVCGEVFTNKVKELSNRIPFPYWNGIKAKETLKPDIITEQEFNGEKTFFILDAKYYTISVDNNQLRHNPGVGDVTKQYLYQLAFKAYLDEKKITNVKNCFLFPGEAAEFENLGNATFEIFNNLELQDIQMIKVPAARIFDMYLKGERLNIEEAGIK